MKPLPFVVERTIIIEADPALVFSFFTDTERCAAWWGGGSTVNPRVGGAIRIVHSNGFVSTGEVFEFAPPTRIGFTFSMQYQGVVPPEDSRVTFTIEPHANGTSVHVSHAVADKVLADLLPQGWRFHLSMFANAVSNLVNAAVPELVDAWFGLWSEPDGEARMTTLRAIAASNACFRDQYSSLTGLEEIALHIAAGRKFMPGIRFERRGPVRHCQGTAIADWATVGPDGQPRTGGTNVFVVRHGKFESVTGIVDAVAKAGSQ
jgi:uncharacterized protein YndB with AHSA1/START domain